MQLLASWRDSLKMFYPITNLKLFGFAVLRAIQVAVSQFLIYGGWLVGLLVAGYFLGFSMASLVIDPLILMCIYLIVRPSVGIKNSAYWKEHWRAVIVGPVVFVFFLFLATIVIIVSRPFLLDESVALYVRYLAATVLLLSLLFSMIFFALMPLWFFFFCDSRATLSDFFLSWKRAFLMAVYAFPVWLFLGVISVLPLFMTVKGSFARLIMAFCLQFIGACVWSVFYTKRLHEQFELYFPGPQIKEQ